MPILSCKEPDCQRKIQARGLCSTHYSYWHRANTLYKLTCQHCDKPFVHGRKDKATCSPECHQDYTRSTEGWQARDTTRPSAPKPPKKTTAELEAVWAASWSPIRAAYERQDWDALIQAIKADSVTTEAGCWQWQRKLKDNYPTVKIAGKTHQVHRLSLHAKHGKPLGVIAAHHKCGNSRCVNPDHLQPVTHRENVAEMMARNSLEARIKELEAALREVSPGHDALNRVSVAA